MEILFETERFYLRKICLDDVQDFFELDSDPDVHKYLGKKPVKTIEQSAEMIQDVLKQYQEYGIGRSAIIDKKSNAFIGWSGIKYETKVRTDYAYYDIGYRLKKAFWGQGIVTETGVASLKYGFEVLKLDKICGGAHVENIASNRILQKLGMTRTETFDFDGDPHHWYEIYR